MRYRARRAELDAESAAIRAAFEQALAETRADEVPRSSIDPMAFFPLSPDMNSIGTGPYDKPRPRPDYPPRVVQPHPGFALIRQGASPGNDWIVF